MKKSIFLFFAAILYAIGMNAADITSDGTARLYFKMNAISWWVVTEADGANYAYFFKDSKNAWSSKAVKHEGNTYYVVIPEGTWNNVILTRNSKAGAGWGSNLYNQTEDIPLSSSSNYIQTFKSGSNGSTASWGTAIKPTSTASVASSAASVFVGVPANLTASLTSNANINTIKSVTYSTTTGASITGNTFTATAEGTYTVTATVTYHPNGYPSLTSTATATTTITAAVPAEEVHDVTVSYMCGGEGIADATTVLSVGVETSVKVTAPEIAKYTFANWTLGADVATTDALTSNEINITTKAGGSDFTLVANYEKAKLTYTVTVPAGTENCYMAGEMNGWDVDNPIELTKQSENVFTVTLEGVEESQEYKYLSQKGTWDYAEVGGNRTWSANDVVTAWNDPLATNVYLVGSMFANWDKTPDKEFRKTTKDATTASIVVALDADKDYELKVRRGDDWTSCTSTITNTVTGLQFSSSNNDNCKMETTVAGEYTFTWTISSSKLAVTYPAIYAITATANDAAMGTVTGAGNYGKGSTATLTANPNDGYLFVNWTKGGVEVATTQEYSFKVTEAVELVANFEAAAEEVHNVTVSYVCGGNKIADDQTISAVGVTTPQSVEAPAIFGYTFASWTLGAGVTSTNTTANPISINTVASGSDFTLTANYTEIPKVTVYFVNNKKWSDVYVYGWEGTLGENPGWPGQKITANKEAEKIAGFDVYSYSVVPGSYQKIIFNKGEGGDDNQTKNYKWVDGKYYWHGKADDFEGVTKDYFSVPVVAGNSTPIFGAGWDIENANNEMQEQADGTYKLVKENVELSAGDVEYKVVIGHFTWDESYTSETKNDKGNSVLAINASGKYNVTFTYNPNNDNKVTATAELLEEVIVLPTISVKGAWDGWILHELVTADDDMTASVEVNVTTTGTHQFGFDVDGNFIANGATIERENNTTTDLTGNSGNMNLVVDQVGNYTFTWTFETNSLEVTFPEKTDEPIVETIYYVRNSANEWNADDASKMEKDGDVYKKTVTFAQGVEFKVANDSWSSSFGYDKLNNQSYKELESGSDGNIKMKEAKTFTIIFNPSENLITFEGLTPKVVEEVTAYTVTVPKGTEKCYIVGAFAESEWSTFIEMTRVGTEDKFTIEVGEGKAIASATSETEYKYSASQNWDNEEVKDASDNSIDNRTWSANDVVVKWKGIALVPGKLTYTVTVPAGTKQCYIAGDMNGWTAQPMTPGGANKFTISFDNVTIFTAYKYTCKDGDDRWAYVEKKNGNGSVDNRTYNANDVVERWNRIDISDGENAAIIGSHKGKGVVEVQVNRQFEADNLYTLSLPFTMSGKSNIENIFGNGTIVYEFSKLEKVDEDLVLYFNDAITTIEAGKPYLIQPGQDVDGFRYENVDVDDTNKSVTNSVDGTIITMESVLSVAANAMTNGKYWLASDNILYRTNTSLLSLRAVFDIQSTKANIRARVAFGENVETGVDNIVTTDAPVKVIKNGQLIIIRDGEMYNVQGQLIK